MSESAKMATVVDQVKETLVGTESGVGLSAQTRSDFMHNAMKDEEGELYMSEKEFVDAIAPEGEDYVRTTPSSWTSNSQQV